MNRKFYFSLLIVIVLIGTILRFTSLSSLPLGLQQDETSLGYNAYSILKTGKDEYGIPFPAHFIAFGEYKLPGYVYLSLPTVWLFGTTPLGIRFPSAFFGSMTILLIGCLANELFREKKQRKLLVVLSMATLALLPWHIFFSRGAFEVTPGLFFLTFSVWVGLVFRRTGRLAYVLISLLFAMAALYTYNTLRILAPILFVFIIFPAKRHISHAPLFYKLLLGTGAVLFLFPFLLTFRDASQATKGTLITTSAVIKAQALEFRSYLTPLPDPIEKIFFSIPLLITTEYLHHIAQYLSVPFYFLTGSPHGNHGIGTHGYLYLFELPLCIVGLFTLRKLKNKTVLYVWIIATILVAAATREAPQATRSFFLIIPLSLIVATGTATLIDSIQSYKKWHILFWTFSIIILGYSFISYAASYIYRFPSVYAKSWRYDDYLVAQYLKDHYEEYQTIIIDNNAGLIYSSLVYTMGFNPSEFQQTAERYPTDTEGFRPMKSFGKITYKDIDWDEDLLSPNTLFITTLNHQPETLSPFMIITLPTRHIVAAEKEKIIQFPVTDSSYVLIETQKE